MRVCVRSELAMAAVAALLLGSAARAGEAPDPAPGAVDVEDALAEPADPDDALDIRADDDPDDVGQEGLEPAQGKRPGAERPAGEDAAPRVDPGRE